MATTYDELPYESHPYDFTHPDHLAVIAKLFGMQPPDVDQCRVLELGCAAGGNLIPQALAAPHGSYLGVDLSERQVAAGRETIQSLGLDNIELRHADIRDIGESDGLFDYIICHGVYSWVPFEVQQRILDVCARQLSPQGVAIVTYNTHPGWYMRGMVRQMMCYHTAQFDDAQKKVQQARALLDFLINTGPAGDPTYHSLLTRELEIIRNRADSYLFHEHLEEQNEPVFFYEFHERCEQANLGYIGETQLSEMVAGNFSKQAEATLHELGVGLIQSEQYLDFLRNRTFRRSLLCRGDVELSRSLDAERLQGLYVASQLRPSDPVDLSSGREDTFLGGSGRTVQVTHPMIKAALLHLHETWPAMTSFDDLLAAAEERRSGRPMIRSSAELQREREDLGGTILELYTADLVELRARPQRFATEISSHPLASPLARLQAEHTAHVSNLRHESVQLTDSQTRLISLLDGGHDLTALTLAFQQWIRDGELVIDQRGEPGSEEAAAQLVEQLIRHDLHDLQSKSLLLR